MLAIRDLSVVHGKTPAVQGISLDVGAGQLISLVGPNGAGKTSTLHAVMCLAKAARGEIMFEGRSLIGLKPEDVASRGISLVPEGRRVLSTLTVAENLVLGTAARKDRGAFEADIARMLEQFPVLERYYRTPAGRLSGGEQQQLAFARALMADPRLLLLDEPSLGLAPKVVDMVFETLLRLRDEGRTILLVEQNARRAIAAADYAYVLRSGKLVRHGRPDDILDDESLASVYFGGV